MTVNCLSCPSQHNIYLCAILTSKKEVLFPCLSLVLQLILKSFDDSRHDCSSGDLGMRVEATRFQRLMRRIVQSETEYLRAKQTYIPSKTEEILNIR